MIESGAAKCCSTISIINLSIGRALTSSTAFLTTIAILITKECISKLRIRNTKLRDWINVFTLIYDKSLKQSMIHLKNDGKEALALKKFYIHYLDKRKEVMENTQFKLENIFGDILNKDNFSQEQISRLNKFSTKIL